MIDTNFEAPDAPKWERSKVIDYCQETAETLDVEFTDEHAAVMEAIFVKDRNVLITGGAGVGKTFLVKDQIIRFLVDKGYNFGVCATTGIAGSHINGRTIHSYLGIGPGPRWAPGAAPQDMSQEELTFHYDVFARSLVEKRGKSSQFQGVLKRLRAISHIILDEVSMMPGNALLGFIDHWLKYVRNNDLPFGGVRMIFCGDPCQLPPVCARGSRTDWAFMSWSWQAASVLPLELTKIFRQSDRHFVDLLNRVRIAEAFTDEDLAYLRSRVIPEGERMLKTMLCATNKEVDVRNKKALDAMPGDVAELTATYRILPHHIGSFSSEEKIREELMRNKPIKEALHVKVGLPVLITVNSPESSATVYFNGSRAKIAELPTEPGGPIRLALDDGGEIVSLSPKSFTRNQDEDSDSTIIVAGKAAAEFPSVVQYPLLPASGITCHRAQGMSLSECLVDLSRVFAPGQVYVALSRLRGPQGLLLASDKFKVHADPFAVRFMQLIRSGFYK